MQNVIVSCLFCQQDFHKKRHECNGFCHALKVGVQHWDVCDACVKVIVSFFESQMRKSPRIRFESP